ncbi:MAG: methyltransferase domain-containing protein [Gemmatimonadota bacterium]
MPDIDRSGSSGGMESVPPETNPFPSALELARLSARRALPGSVDLYRQVARMFELDSDMEFLVVPGCRGLAARHLVELTGAGGAAVDPDEELVAAATALAKEGGLGERLHYDHAPLTELPYKDAVFDFTLGESALSSADPARAVAELARVTRPMGTIVLIQFVWLKKVTPARQDAIVHRLGVQPLLAMEWKQLLREAGVVDLHTEDWSAAAASLRQPAVLGTLAVFTSVLGTLSVLPRAWRRWGWRGVATALSMGTELHRLLVDEKVLGVSLIKGTRWKAERQETAAGVSAHPQLEST